MDFGFPGLTDLPVLRGLATMERETVEKLKDQGLEFSQYVPNLTSKDREGKTRK